MRGRTGQQGKRHRASVLVVVVLVVTALAGCAEAPGPATASKGGPAKVEAVPNSELSRLRLVPKAAERLGIQTAPVEAVTGPGGAALAIPYSAVIYDPQGSTWTYTSPEPLVYVRDRLEIARIDGDKATLKKGPAVGTQVVTVGAAELFGTEFKTGK